MIDAHLVLVGDGGEFQNASFYAAWKGFGLLGRDVVKATLAEIEATPASPRTLVFGGVEAVRSYLRRLNREPPELDYPESLHHYLGRGLRTTTLAEIRHRYRDQGPAVFVKPVQHKLFKGHIVSRFRDLIGTASWSDETPVYVLDCVEFSSEWRFYLRRGQVVGAAHYAGDPLMFPDPTRVRSAAEDLARSAGPVACGIDFGVARDGSTCLVEVNDMFALGCYGLDPVLYATLIEDRWAELVEHA